MTAAYVKWVWQRFGVTGTPAQKGDWWYNNPDGVPPPPYPATAQLSDDAMAAHLANVYTGDPEPYGPME